MQCPSQYIILVESGSYLLSKKKPFLQSFKVAAAVNVQFARINILPKLCQAIEGGNSTNKADSAEAPPLCSLILRQLASIVQYVQCRFLGF